MNKTERYLMCGSLEVTPSGKLIYMALSGICDRKNEIVISHGDLGRLLGLSRHTIRRSLRRLERIGCIETEVRCDYRAGRLANKYTVKTGDDVTHKKNAWMESVKSHIASISGTKKSS